MRVIKSQEQIRRGDADINRVLIFLLGSLGDTLVALPALHLIARQFPSSERRMLTDRSLNPKAASMESLLDGTGLVDHYYWFPPPSRDSSRVRPLMRLAREIRAWKPDALIYLHEQRGQVVALRDAAVFRLIGIRRLIGVPLTRSLQQHVFCPTLGRFEHRSEYLARSLASLGDPRLTDRASWSLALSEAERSSAEAHLQSLSSKPGILGMSIGTKIDVNDWGDDNWRRLLSDLSARLPDWALVAIGAPSEHSRTSALMRAWHGPSVNLCGKLSVRESGAVLERARVFVGHDSGPMHLAATVGTVCVAVFSARHLPGLWFPYGNAHRVIYHQTDCAGCRRDNCVEFKKKCIASIAVNEVADAVTAVLTDGAALC